MKTVQDYAARIASGEVMDRESFAAWAVNDYHYAETVDYIKKSAAHVRGYLRGAWPAGSAVVNERHGDGMAGKRSAYGQETSQGTRYARRPDSHDPETMDETPDEGECQSAWNRTPELCSIK